jgi:hypothetical protein
MAARGNANKKETVIASTCALLFFGVVIASAILLFLI